MAENNLACAYRLVGRTAESLALLDRIVPSSTQVLGADHPWAITVRYNLARAYQDAGRLDEAVEFYQQTYHDRLRILGSDHPQTVKAGEALTAAVSERNGGQPPPHPSNQ
jgi:hypothetical protein